MGEVNCYFMLLRSLKPEARARAEGTSMKAAGKPA